MPKAPGFEPERSKTHRELVLQSNAYIAVFQSAEQYFCCQIQDVSLCQVCIIHGIHEETSDIRASFFFFPAAAPPVRQVLY